MSDTVVRRPFIYESERETARAALNKMSEVEGVLETELDKSKMRLWLTYDALKTDYSTLCSELTKAGVRLAARIWSRWRRDWYSFQDRNIRDNAGHRPACCSKPPPGAGRR
jgi:hypothetical protein